MYHPRLAGSHYDMGLHYGQILYKTGEDLSSIIVLDEEQIEFGKKCLPIYEKYMRDIMNEVNGLAVGLGKKYEDIAYWLMNLYCNEEDYGCSVFAIKSNNGIFFARNMDMFPEYKKTSESILYRPTNKYTFLGHSTAMISIEDGINEHGLCVALNFLLSKKINPGINGGFIIRKVLEECKTVDEAIALIKSMPISSSHNFTLADKTGAIAVVECSCLEVNVRYHQRYVIATNHFISEKMAVFNNKNDNWYLTKDRYESIKTYLDNNDIVDFEECKKIISGKYGFVCQFAKSLNFTTIWSVVYDLNSLYIEICEGNPSRSPFKYDNRLDWALNKKDNVF